ncbi:MAG: GrpE protein [Marmoricola sp.]|nr:GrpE protein [Marmoricola sp.]MCW2888077.1 GrpE protein [Streptosporangiaceae bacterium]MDX6428220.1 molecular chaperone GrpE [Streptosporangiaceae bacterium]
MSVPPPNEGGEREGPVIRDKRRIDPVTGEVREPAATPAPAAAAETAKPGAGPAPGNETEEGDSEVAKLQEQLDERTSDLQRIQAEYSNYRKRVERDRVAVREQSLGNVLNELLPILDDIGRAREHDELTGGFKSVGEALEAAVGKLGLERFGEKGEPFDPTVHEALIHSYSADVAEPTCVDILQPGYRIGARILRPARVAVAEPVEPGETVESAETDDTK